MRETAGSGIVAVTGAVALAPQKPKAATAVAATPAASPGVRVYYFHATTRCATCKTIEAYAHETVASKFAADLEARRLEGQAVNVGEPANQHFIRDFQLYTRSVVVVDAKDPKRYKVLSPTGGSGRVRRPALSDPSGSGRLGSLGVTGLRRSAAPGAGSARR